MSLVVLMLTVPPLVAAIGVLVAVLGEEPAHSGDAQGGRAYPKTQPLADNVIEVRFR